MYMYKMEGLSRGRWESMTKTGRSVLEMMSK